MATIKEKAEELVEKRVELSREESFAYFHGFEDGASYVLECFESILPFVAKKGIIYGKIKETIEQLKK